MRWGWLATARPEEDSSTEKPEPSSSVRITFVVLTFAGGCLLLPPRQWISSAILISLSIFLGVIFRRDIASWLFPPDSELPSPPPPVRGGLQDPEPALLDTRQADENGD